ncbi:MAG: hypothetical protein WC598_09080 [Methanoregula sp.]
MAPPKEIPPPTPAPTSVTGDLSTQFSNASDNPAFVTTTASYLKDATPYPTRVTPASGIPTLVAIPVTDPDQVCLISLENFNAATGVKKSAKEFTLVNPPMYINYTIKDPSYITGTKIVVGHSSQAESVTYKQINPASYLEITVRSRTNGTIYLQDGFGKEYGQYLAKTIKITKPGDLLIEFSGNKVTANIGVWVKPVGNFDENVTFANVECKSPKKFGSSSLDLPKTS